MSRTAINVGAVIEASSQIKLAKTSVSNAKSSFTQTKNSIDEKIKKRYNIRARLNSVQSRMSAIETRVGKIQSTVESGANLYVRTDAKIEGWREDIRHDVGVTQGGTTSQKWADYFEKIDLAEQLTKKTTTESGAASDSLEKYLAKAKAYAIVGILNTTMPGIGLLYVASGIPMGKSPSFLDPTRTPNSDAGADWTGYELNEDNSGVTGWVGKAYANTQNEWGYAEVNATLGKGTAEVKSDFAFMETKKTYKDGKWTESTEVLHAEIAAGGSASVVAIDGKAGVGTDMLGGEVSGEGSLGNAKLGGKGEFSISDEGVDAYLSGEALVSAAEGEVKGTINLFGLEITGMVGGYAGAYGVEGEVGVKDSKWVAKGGAAAVLGVSVGVEVGFNEEGWDNFVEYVTFWD